MKSFFSPKEVQRLADVSYRQIQYWDKSSFISPSYRRRGKYRLYTFSDLVQIKLVETLRRNGYSIQKLRRTLETIKGMLRKASFPFTDLKMIFERKRILLFRGDLIMTGEPARYVYFSAGMLTERLREIYGTE